jgi:LemA protein
MKRYLLLILCCLAFSSCGYNAIQKQDEAVTAAWSKVVSQYQRRADLVPNLVKTVQAFAAHETEVFDSVTQARAKVGSLNITPDVLNDEATLKKFQEAQSAMSGALSRLLAVAENYPTLKSDSNFLDLQKQLEGTENRIAVARGDFIEAVQQYNSTVRSFPVNLTAKLFGYRTKPTFTVENEKEISTAPKVDFGKTAP